MYNDLIQKYLRKLHLKNIPKPKIIKIWLYVFVKLIHSLILFRNTICIGLAILKSKFWMLIARCSFDRKKKNFRNFANELDFSELRINWFSCLVRVLSAVLFFWSQAGQALVINIITNLKNTIKY